VLDLNAVVHEIGKMLPRLIGEHIEYEFLPGEELQSIKADPGQIEQAIMNLAVNARDAMPEGGKLTIRTSNVALSRADTAQRAPMLPGLYVLFSVTDTGHGMDEKTVQHIFEPFFTTKEVGKGTGLGLATVYGVVKQSGGFIWVESAPGKGTTFEVYLPQVSEAAQSADTVGVPAAALRGTETILVVEDEVGVRDLACRFLKASGYRVLEAADGMEALQIASQYEETIHLVLTDVVMPRLGGKALAEQIRARRKDTKILFMSGYTEYTSNTSGELSALGSALQKPFSRLSLTAKVREVLSGTPIHEVDGTVAARIL
jgi:CheY-like chemotaxis protein